MGWPFGKKKSTSMEEPIQEVKTENGKPRPNERVIHNVDRRGSVSFETLIESLCRKYKGTSKDDIVDLVLRKGKVEAEVILQRQAEAKNKQSSSNEDISHAGGNNMENPNPNPNPDQTGSGQQGTGNQNPPQGDPPKKQWGPLLLRIAKYAGCVLFGIGLGIGGTRAYDKIKAGKAPATPPVKKT